MVLQVDEIERLVRLYSLGILDTQPEDIFDTLTRVAADVCGTSSARLNFLDQERLWAKSIFGVKDYPQMPRDVAICFLAISMSQVLEIPDVRLETGFLRNPLVQGDRGFRFYASMPLLIDGFCVGTLCVMDEQPGKLTDHQIRTLSTLSMAVINALDTRQKFLVTFDNQARSRRNTQRLYRTTPAMLQSTNAEGQLIAVSDRWLSRLGYTRQEVLGRPFSSFLASPLQHDPIDMARASMMEEDDIQTVECRMVCKDGTVIDVGLASSIDRAPDKTFSRMTTVVEETTLQRSTGAAFLAGPDTLDDVVSAVGMGSWELDLSTRRVSWSDQTCRLHDREPGCQPTLGEWLSYYTSHSRPIIDAAITQAIMHRVPWDLELELVSARGRPFWARVVGQAEPTEGAPTRLTGAFQDITGRKLLERELAVNRELLQVTLNSIGDAVITTDTERLVRWMNPVAERLTGWSSDEVLGKPIATVFRLLNEVERQVTFHPVEECIRLNSTIKLAVGTVLVSRDASEYAIAASAAPIQDANGQILGAVLVFQDVTEQRRQDLQMEHRATHDALTDLANRVAFETRIDALLARARTHPDFSHVLLFIDLDQFKIVNDTCGHLIGDVLLREISQVLTACVRDRDMVARLGGDEFAVILEDCPVEHGKRIAERIRIGVFEHRFFHDQRRFRVGSSIGLIPFDGRWSAREKLVQAADMTCYAAKEAGRNQVKTWSESDQSVIYRLGDVQWAARLEQAIENDQFELFGQRIEALTDGRSDVRCEVLLRLRDMDGSLVLPRIFVPAAERFHMVARVDRWVLHRVIHLLETSPWLFDTIGMLSVNVSGQSIGDRAFHADICARLQRASFDMSKLCIEITETSAVTRLADARAFISELRGMGVKIALDDFGAGASSFGYLKALPVDFIKIDGQFSENILADPLDIAAVRCFRDVASTLGVMTIAQYVESHDQKHALTSLGIDFGQGYGIHRPEPLEQAVGPGWSRPDIAARSVGLVEEASTPGDRATLY